MLGGMLLCAPAHACSVPVFRYALERWEADAYRVTVAYDGALSPESQALLDGLTQESLDPESPVNLVVTTSDLASAAEDFLQDVAGGLPVGEGPQLILRHPHGAAGEGIVWAAPLSSASVAALTGSPARREIAGRILRGEAAVWILLEGGSKDEDEKAASLLHAQLTRLEKMLSGPARPYGASATANQEEAADLPPAAPASDDVFPQPQVSFSMLRVSRHDPREAVLRSMLLASEPDLDEYPDQPIAFAVFGRGRVLYALVGRGINSENVEKACRFLAGPCACDIKAKSSGIDLLIVADWQSAVSGEALTEVPESPLTGVLPLPAAQGPLQPPAPRETAEVADAGGSTGGLVRNTVGVLAAACVLAAVGAAVLRLRQNRARQRASQGWRGTEEEQET